VSRGVHCQHARGELTVYRHEQTRVVSFSCNRCGRHWKATEKPVHQASDLTQLDPDAYKCWSCDLGVAREDIPEAL
jgi:hypothetical protein